MARKRPPGSRLRAPTAARWSSPELRGALREFDAAMADPDVVVVGLSPGLAVVTGKLSDTFVLPMVPGLAMVFYYDRDVDNVRVLPLDAEAQAWTSELLRTGDYSALKVGVLPRG